MKSATKTSIERFIANGLMPGNFLQAVMSNDLRGAVFHADEQNRQDIAEIFLFIRDNAPLESWGTESKLWIWAEQGGIEGLRKKGAA